MQIGFPLELQSVLVNISFLIITIIVNQMGLIASASLDVVGKLMEFLMLPAIALGSALASLIVLNVKPMVCIWNIFSCHFLANLQI